MDVLKVLCILFFISISTSFKFLVVFPYAVKSLNMLGEGIVKLLTSAGHEVTYISSFPLKNDPEKNVHHIVLSQNFDVLLKCRSESVNSIQNQQWFTTKIATSHSNLSIDFIMKNQLKFNDPQYFQEAALKTALSTFDDEEVIKLLEDVEQKFDAVIVDWFQTDVYSGLSALYNCPMIWSYSMGVDWMVTRLVDGLTNPAYTSDYLSSNVPPFNFIQRIQELWIQLYSYFIKRFVITPKEKSVYTRTFGPLLKKRNITLPEYEDLLYNASLLFINDHQAIGRIPSVPQNVKLVGGYHIDTPVKPLAENLKSLLDKAKHGVIYFAMGSTWQSKDIPRIVTDQLLQMFGELKQTVVWKYEAELNDLPKNVHIVKWAPQQSILAHKNCILFITHGGILSANEAVYFGVPTIGIPVYIDQFKNINIAAANGHSLKVDLNMDLAKNLKVAIDTMQRNPKYHERVKELSSIYHDWPLAPGAELVHWVEHVVRTRGAAHLRSPALRVRWYQKLYLDLVVVMLIVLLMLKIILHKIWKSLRCLIVIKNKNKEL